MKLLGIETATEACSAALWLDGEVRERFELAPRRHAELILSMVDELLADAGMRLADLDGLAFGHGPGAFTGVRIATGVIQGLSLARELPVVGVSTLAALAQTLAANDKNILAALDARMGEVYWGTYQLDDSGSMRLVGHELVVAPESVPVPDTDGWVGAGSGWSSHEAALTTRMGHHVTRIVPDAWPRAGGLLPIAAADFAAGLAVDAAAAQPVYLRNRVINT